VIAVPGDCSCRVPAGPSPHHQIAATRQRVVQIGRGHRIGDRERAAIATSPVSGRIHLHHHHASLGIAPMMAR